MSRPPVVKASELVKTLKKLGFVNTRRAGSHFFFKHTDGRTTVVPVHQGKSVGLGLMRGILSDIKMSTEELKKHL